MGANQYTYGKKMSDETKKKLSESSKKQVWSEDRKKFHSERMKQAVTDNPDSYSSGNRGRVKRIEFDGKSFQGKWELYFYQWCLRNNIKIDKCIVFTLDDGYLDNYTNALPIFIKYNVPFTIYITTSFPDHKFTMWWYALEDIILNSNCFLFIIDIYKINIFA